MFKMIFYINCNEKMVKCPPNLYSDFQLHTLTLWGSYHLLELFKFDIITPLKRHNHIYAGR